MYLKFYSDPAHYIEVINFLGNWKKKFKPGTTHQQRRIFFRKLMLNFWLTCNIQEHVEQTTGIYSEEFHGQSLWDTEIMNFYGINISFFVMEISRANDKTCHIKLLSPTFFNVYVALNSTNMIWYFNIEHLSFCFPGE